MKPLIHKNVIIGNNTILEDNVEIGKISNKQTSKKKIVTKIGDNCYIRRGTIIYAGTVMGDNCQTGHNTLIREENIIGSNVSIGSFTELALRNTIQDNTRIHSGCFLEDVFLGKNVFVGPHCVFTNDPHPNIQNNIDCFKGAYVEDEAMIGGHVTLLPHIRVGKRSLVGAGSVVTKNVPAAAVVVGNPARQTKSIIDIICRKQEDSHKPYENYSSR